MGILIQVQFGIEFLRGLQLQHAFANHAVQGTVAPFGKRSSLRNKSYEVEPAPGRKVCPSRGYPQVIRPPPLSDGEAALFNTSRSVLLNSAQSPPEIAPDIS